MGTYLMMLYVSLDQEKAVKQLFLDNEWSYYKLDLSALTEQVGAPLIPKFRSKQSIKTLLDNKISKDKEIDVKSFSRVVTAVAKDVTGNTAGVTAMTKTADGAIQVVAGVTQDISDINQSIDGVMQDISGVKRDISGVAQDGDSDGDTDDDLLDENERFYLSVDDENVEMNKQPTNKKEQINKGQVDGTEITQTSSGLPGTVTPRKSCRLSSKAKTSYKALSGKRQRKSVDNASVLNEGTGESNCCVRQKKIQSDKQLVDPHTQDHGKQIVKEEMKSGLAIFECSMCSQTFRDTTLRDKHYFQAHNMQIDLDDRLSKNVGKTDMVDDMAIKSTICEDQVKDKSELENDNIEKHEMSISSTNTEVTKFPCNFCDSVYLNHKRLKSHISAKHKVNTTGKQNVIPYCCKYCSATFDKLGVYRGHLKQVHNVTSLKEHIFICDFCGKTFKRLDYLKGHRNVIHLGIKKKSKYEFKGRYQVCDFCGSKFKRKCHLDEHIAMKHDHTVIHKHFCSACGKSFPRPSKLEYHINKEHLHSKPYTCKICQGRFFSKVTLSNHLKMCEMNDDDKIKCQHCDQKFKNKYNLKLHLQAKHSDPALICACGTVVRWKSSVAKHKRRCPLGFKSIGEEMKVKTEIVQETVGSKIVKEIDSKPSEVLVIYESSIDKQSDNSIKESVAPRVTQAQGVADQIEAIAARRDILSETSQATEIYTESLEGVGSETIECTVDEQILNDIVNGVDEQVVEISSTPQSDINTSNCQNVFYVIMNK